MSALNPASLALIRASIRGEKPSDGTFARGPIAFLSYVREGGGYWELHAYGRLQARSERSDAFRAMLIREAEEPGFIAIALRPSIDPETALLPRADLREREARLIASQEAHAAAVAAKEDEEWRKRRLNYLDITQITLDDLD